MSNVNASLIHLLPTIVPSSAPWTEALATAALKYNIANDKHELAHWLGQQVVETGRFTLFRESLNYSVDRLLDIFSRTRISAADAERYGRKPGRAANQQAIANIVYGGAWGKKNLGNTQPNDGWHFRGAGPKQTTGRANFKRASQELYGDDRLMVNPELLAQPEAGALAAAVYWDDARRRGIDAAARRNDYVEVRRLVNGGSNGLDGPDGTIAWTKKIQKLFNI